MDPTSVGFMMADSRNTPMHVGGLHLYRPPDGNGPDYGRELFDSMRSASQIAPLFLKRPFRSVRTAGAWTWTPDDQFDLDHHVRHSALPRPGRVRELLELVGRLHGQRLSADRPLWEFHLIEGLEDGRVATYTKLHHALVDGVAAVRLLQSSHSTDPDERDMPAPWGLRDAVADAPPEQARVDDALLDVPMSALRQAVGVLSDAAGLPGALVRSLNRSVHNESAPMALFAPRTILNKNITGARRFAAQDWSIERLKAVGKATGTSVNDVVLAVCGGALRSYLQELDALPPTSLVAMVPVGLKARQVGVASAAGGNAVASLMAKLGTDLADSAERLDRVHTDLVAGKRAMASMTPMQIVALSALGNAPALLTPLLRLQGVVRPPYNVIVSNVPGPRRPLYLNGARLAGMYPVSIPVHGVALNITCTSYDGELSFGYTGCRRTVPSLQRLLTHTEEELTALERAVGAA